MKDLERKICKAIKEVSPKLHGKKIEINKRVEIFMNALDKQGVECSYEGEKPSSGATFVINKMSKGYRVNVRCGYSRHNYAPCVFIPFR